MEQTNPSSPGSIADLQPKMLLHGVVKETHLYGAVVDIGLERDGMVHISQLAPKRINRVTDVVEVGDEVSVWVTKVDEERGRIALTMVEPPDVDWNDLAQGQVHKGTVCRMEPYGVFIDIGAERPGLLHVREMSTEYVRHPSELVQMDDEVEVQILKVDRRKRRIDLSMASLHGQEEPRDFLEEENLEPSMTAMEIALQQAQAQRQPRRRRDKKKNRRKKSRSPDLVEREEILSRTLEEHSQQ